MEKKADKIETTAPAGSPLTFAQKGRTLTLAAIVTFALIVAAVNVAQFVRQSQSYHKLDKRAETIASALDRTVLYSENLGVTGALGAANRDVEDVILGRKQKDDPDLLKALNRIKFLYRAAVVYVMDRNGDVVACTPYGQQASLTGENYAFRPYFKEAVNGFATVYPALGVTTNKRGLYYSSPAYRPSAGNRNHDIIGVVVMKMDLLQLDSFLDNIADPVALVSPLGIVFASNMPDWRFKSAFTPDADKFSHLMDNSQFNRLFSEKPPQAIPAGLDAGEVVLNGIKYAASSIDMSLADEFGKWKLIFLGDISIPWYRNSAAIFCIAAVILVCTFGTIAFLSHDRKRAAEKHRKQVEQIALRFGKILEESLNEIYIFDARTLRFIQVNKGARKNLGYSMDELRLLTPLDIKPEFDPESFHELVEPLRNGRRDGIGFRSVHRRKDGSTYPVEVHLQMSSLESSEVFAAIVLDITERKLAEETLKTGKEQAEAANKAKSEFLANMSHEIRTPMNAIMGFSEILAEEDLTPEQHNYVRTICNSGDHLLQLIDDILDFSKIEAGKLDICFDDCSIRELIEDVESLMRPAATNKGIKFEILQCSGLPAKIHTDIARLRQCLINVINNALKFTEQGYVYVNVSLENRDGDDYISFGVEDTGIGIPSDRRQIIFESFRQADGSMARKFGGTGLGLAITKKLMNLMGGDITLSSCVGKGSVFTLSIPVGQINESQETLDIYANAVDLIAVPDDDSPLTFTGEVLVVEDTVHNQIFIKTMLERMGLHVTIADDGAKAVEAALTKHYDMIFMDIQMPVMNGYEATSSLRRKGVKTPIIAVTANAMTGDDEKCIEAGCDHYIKKPIDRKLLKRIIQQHLSPRQEPRPSNQSRQA